MSTCERIYGSLFELIKIIDFQIEVLDNLVYFIGDFLSPVYSKSARISISCTDVLTGLLRLQYVVTFTRRTHISLKVTVTEELAEKALYVPYKSMYKAIMFLLTLAQEPHYSLHLTNASLQYSKNQNA